MIEIDGSQGEGGGQVLRSSLALSILTRQDLHIDHIRANRSNPGLRPQHLRAVRAAAAICNAEKGEVRIGSGELVFRPGDVRSGRYTFDIGTAGSTSLVLQTIFLPLTRANSASTVIITGGTHVPWSPSFHYLNLQWLPFMRKLGFDAQLSMDLAGFYPQGGGRITATIRPVQNILPLNLPERGKLLGIQGISAVANLDPSIADRQKRQGLLRLQKEILIKASASIPVKIKTVRMPSHGKGTMLLLLAEFEGGSCCYYALGERGKPAERVADEAVDALLAFIDTDGTVDQYLADQLILPLSIAEGPSAFRTSKITHHLMTNAAVIRSFLPARIELHGALGEPGVVLITPEISR